jgi:hypothetical protein
MSAYPNRKEVSDMDGIDERLAALEREVRELRRRVAQLERPRKPVKLASARAVAL